MPEVVRTMELPLIGDAAAALDACVVREGFSHVEVMNRAVQLYDALSEAKVEGGAIYVRQPDGQSHELTWHSEHRENG